MFDEIKIQEDEDICISQISQNCPVCNSILVSKGKVYSTEQLFELWKPIEFSANTIEEHRYQSKFTQMFSCPTCELDIFLPPIIGSPQFYKELQNYEKSCYYEETKWEFFESEKDVKNLKSLIEIGCGTGNYLDHIKKIRLDSWGIEYNEEAIKVAKDKGLNIISINEEKSLKKGSFDVSISFHVLEHIKQPREFVLNMTSWVNMNGKICISVPNQEGPIKYIEPCHMNMPPHHSTRWRKKTFEVLAERLNLKIERISYEPLLICNHSYYSYYWVNSTILGDTNLKRLMRYFLNRGLTVFFEVLKVFQLKYFHLLRGQSIYVVMSKSGD